MASSTAFSSSSNSAKAASSNMAAASANFILSPRIWNTEDREPGALHGLQIEDLVTK